MLGSQRPEELLPKSIDRYKIVRRLGRGGMGVVYLAKRADDTISFPVALKVLKRGLDTDHILSRFNLERQLLGALNHPNIARLFDAGSTPDGLPFFVMEYIEGETLDKHCETGQLSVAERLRLFQRVCAGVHALHQSLIVHRDLKPANILVTPQGEPKILDLGIAKLVNPVMGGMAEQTVGEHQLMTPEYASPEQVAGRAITTASDIYALGMILYELLSGQKPYHFRSRTTEEIRRVVCDLDPEKPSTRVSRASHALEGSTGTTLLKRLPPQRLARTLVGDLDDIVMMALEKVPSRRYASAQDLADDIGRYLGAEPVRARRTSRRSLYRAAKFVRRNRTTVAFGTAGALGLAVSAGVALLGWKNAAEAGQAEARARTEAVAARVEAERQRDLARSESQAKLAAVREGLVLAARQLTSTYEALAAEVDEPTERLRALVDGGLAFAEKARALAPDEPGVDALLAEGYEKLAVLNYSPDKPHLGRPSLADQALRECIEMRERALAAQPDAAKPRLDLWQTYRFAAQAARALGDPARALDLANKSLQLATTDESRTTEDAAKQNPQRNARRRAVSLATQAQALFDLGRIDDAREAVAESVRLRREFSMREAGRTSPDELMGEHLLMAERPEEALPPLRANLASIGDLGSDARSRRRAAAARFLLGDALARTAQTAEGIQLMERGLADSDLTLEGGELKPAQDSGDLRRVSNRAEMLGRLGEAYLRADRDADALRAFGAQSDLGAKLIERDGAHLRARLLRARGLVGQSEALARLKRGPEAARAAEAALEEALRAYARAPELPDACRTLAAAHAAVGDRLPENSPERGEAYSRAVQSLGRLVSSDQRLPSDEALLKRAAAASGRAGER